MNWFMQCKRDMSVTLLTPGGASTADSAHPSSGLLISGLSCTDWSWHQLSGNTHLSMLLECLTPPRSWEAVMANGCGRITAFSLHPEAQSLFSKSKASLSHVPCRSPSVETLALVVYWLMSLIPPGETSISFPYGTTQPVSLTLGRSSTLHFLFPRRQ